MNTIQFSSGENSSPTKPALNEMSFGLADYVRIIWKRKISMILVFGFVVIAAVVYNLLLPETFQAHAFIKIGKSEGKEIISLGEIKTVFSTLPTLAQVAMALDMPAEIDVQSVASLFKISADEINKSDLVVVKGLGETPEKAVMVVNAVAQVLLKQHSALFDVIEKKEKMEIELLKREQVKTEQDIKRVQQNIVQCDNDIKFFQAEIKKRDAAQSDGQGRIVEGYINLLAQAKVARQNKAEEVAQLQLKLKNYDFIFFQRELEKKFNTKMTEVEISPILPRSHIAPNRTQNVKLFMLIGLILAILYAFVLEFVSKNKSMFAKSSPTADTGLVSK